MSQNIMRATGKLKRGWYYASVGREAGQTVDVYVRKGFVAVDCAGEAHSNPHIDNCGRCAPLWGVMVVKDE